MSRVEAAATLGLVCVALFQGGCVPALPEKVREASRIVPPSYAPAGPPGQASTPAGIGWAELFSDPHLRALIETALKRNQELNILLQEISIASNEVMARGGELLPRLGLRADAGIEKVGESTSQGQSDARHGVAENLQNYRLGLFASWEIDVWKKLRNAKQAAVLRYLATIEGRRFMVTRLVAEVAESYNELMALDNLLLVVEQNIGVWQSSMEMVKVQKEGARATELAVQRFKAEVLKNQSRQYALRQEIIRLENRINFLVGRFPQPVARSSATFNDRSLETVKGRLPGRLLEDRPDVRRAELELEAAKLDVKVARAQFYPALSLEAALGYQAFSITQIVSTPASLFYGLGASLSAPLLNRSGIKAAYFSASAKQMQAVLGYEQTLLKAYFEVANQLATVDNLQKSYELKLEQVQTLHKAIEMAGYLFSSARIDYLEVLTTRRDALDSQLELIETRKKQMNAVVKLYQALGGGWR